MKIARVVSLMVSVNYIIRGNDFIVLDAASTVPLSPHNFIKGVFTLGEFYSRNH